ncbi:uncharacterized protein LOC130827353 [Amaranthus tricolor]|uniref:uncharacterized protein LOC130827353 n=1 Tax=Amaranthus tricolor TaxID=29722 RepID=UPI00258FC25D|nr:uncharacterized protein LOC130827353 [Amaranthus tricolor]
MFITVVARPPVNTNGDILWDGKIGIFPFTETQIPIRSSGNKQAGTPELKAITKATRYVIREKFISGVLPAIRSKWPANGVRDIWIQQDNARPHILTTDHAFDEAATQDGFNIRLVCQLASSIQFGEFPRDIPSLIKALTDAYNTFNPRFLNYSWIQYQLYMLEVLKVRGGNNYEQPHMGKKRLDKLGELPSELEVPSELIGSTH